LAKLKRLQMLGIVWRVSTLRVVGALKDGQVKEVSVRFCPFTSWVSSQKIVAFSPGSHRLEEVLETTVARIKDERKEKSFMVLSPNLTEVRSLYIHHAQDVVPGNCFLSDGRPKKLMVCDGRRHTMGWKSHFSAKRFFDN
jgi:hypothetical protein